MGKPATPIVRIDFPDGRWARMHLASVNQQIAISELPKGDEAIGFDFVKYWLGEFRDSTDETSWGGDIGDGITAEEISPFLHKWMEATEDIAVPPASGSSSGTPQPKPRSRQRTAKGRSSGSRGSSRS